MKKTISKPHDKWGRLQRESLKHIKGNDLRVYADLRTYANDKGKCWPSVATIAQDLGMHTRNVQKSLANLEQDGWIEKHFRKDTSTIYQLYYVKVKDEDKPKTKKSLKKKMKPSDGVVKSTRSGVVKRTAPQMADLTVSGVAVSTTLTDHLTDHNNRPSEQVDVVVVNENNDEYQPSVEEKDKFERLFRIHSKRGESKSSAKSAYKRYASKENSALMKYIETGLDTTSTTYMTNQMKVLVEEYNNIQEAKANAIKSKKNQDDWNKAHPEQQM